MVSKEAVDAWAVHCILLTQFHNRRRDQEIKHVHPILDKYFLGLREQKRSVEFLRPWFEFSLIICHAILGKLVCIERCGVRTIE